MKDNSEKIKELEKKCAIFINLITSTTEMFGQFTDQNALDVYRKELKETLIKIHKLRKLEQ